MTTQDIIKILTGRLNLPQNEVKNQLLATLSTFRLEFGKQNGFSILGFGTFKVRKRNKRKSFNPFIDRYFILPPKMILSFRPSPILKENINTKRRVK